MAVQSKLLIENLSVAVQDKPVLQQLSLSADAGTTHAIMGPNGSGKSTLALALAGYPGYDITHGMVRLHEQNLLDMSAHERARVGLFLGFQQPPAIPGLQVQLFVHAMTKALGQKDETVEQFQARLQHAFELVGLSAHFATRNVNEGFSGGERKRFELAQAVMACPKVLILDEIDSGLDVDALSCIKVALSYLRKQNPTMITLCITHYTRVLDAVGCDFVHVLRNGQLLQSGTIELAHVVEQGGYQQWQ